MRRDEEGKYVRRDNVWGNGELCLAPEEVALEHREVDNVAGLSA